MVNQLYGSKAADDMQVLYGGSVNSDSAASYLDIDEIDGLLIGETSLNAQAFNEIIKKAHNGSRKAKKD